VDVPRPLAHDALIERLWLAARAGRLPHALLFEGRAGIGKFTAARWFALGCLCARGPGVPCLACGPCRRVTSGGGGSNHADLFVIDPLAEGEERIRIGRIAERSSEGEESAGQSLESFLGLRALEGGMRVVLVRECQRMNVPAQNALLKTLEEPRPGTLMVLETHRPASLLATIKSRCIRIRFEALSRAQCEQVLAARGLEAHEAGELARLAEGSPGLALAMAQNGSRAIRARLVAAALGEASPLDVAEELWEVEGEFAGKTSGAEDRERGRVVLDLAQALVRDAWRARAGVPAADLANGDVAVALARRADERELARRGEFLAQARVDVDQNLAPGPLLERALLVLADGAHASRP
jgi:DNA polymerase III subunit delta'